MLESILLDSMNVTKVLTFYNLVIAFIIRNVFIGNGAVELDALNWSAFMRGDSQSVSFDIEGAPGLFTTIPEWFFEDICEYYLFVVRYICDARINL